MTSRVFFSKSSEPQFPSSNLPTLFRESIALLFPNAVSFDWPDGSLVSPRTIFLRENENIFWVEFTPIPFTRNEISGYLAKARQIQSTISSGISGVLVAPEFETGVRELLELIRIPMRFLRYREAFSLGLLGRHTHESVLCLEEIVGSDPGKGSLPAGLPQKKILSEPFSVGAGSLRNRLSREELREFIQLELDLAK